MLTKEEFCNRIAKGAVLDGATGSWLRAHGMPKGCSTELWVLDHPDILTELQRGYARAGADIIYAPTFQAQPIVLAAYGREKDTEEINRSLVALSRRAAPGCLIAGDLTTLAGSCDSFDPKCFDLLVKNYRRQIRGLMDGGADLLVGETLMYPQEAEAILTAAELEGAGAAMYSFTMQPDGSLFSGAEAGPVLRELEKAGACAVGFNCVPADDMTAGLVLKLRRFTKLPLICKPNAGIPVINAQGIAEYDLNPECFAKVMAACHAAGAMLLGGCCGTTPEHLAALTGILSETEK
ncbi:MAG: homocysteine S-methyltransferase family protein [Oscillospiraceae bacterium]|nr:homocysteine S-methyltransferase family protein [Oscillospiraceae bacterium]